MSWFTLICRDMKWESQLNICAPGTSVNCFSTLLCCCFQFDADWRGDAADPAVKTINYSLLLEDVFGSATNINDSWEHNMRKSRSLLDFCVLRWLNSHCCTSLFLLCCMNVIIPFTCIFLFGIKSKTCWNERAVWKCLMCLGTKRGAVKNMSR